MKEEIAKSTIVTDFNTLLSKTDRIRQRSNKETGN
jgi:hypothetical protein